MHASNMARRENTVELNFIDTDFSSGDSNQMKSKHYKEENNNEVDELSKDLSEMGCIVDAVKRPNICVEACVYEESDSENEVSEVYHEEDAYSDEFEDEKSEEEDKSEICSSPVDSVKSLPKSIITDTSREPTARSSVKLTKSQSSMGSHKPPGSVSGRSTSFGSISGNKTRRINMSFTNERLREIERHNNILLSKILSARNTKKTSMRDQEPRRAVPSAAVCRKSQQKKIDHDNMILLKKIQRVKSSAYSMRR